jgi:peptidylprolyl isomerase
MNILKNPYVAIAGLAVLLVAVYMLLPKSMPENNQTNSNEVVNVTLVTTMGNIELELYKGQMPITVGNFVELAQADFYDGVKFHRVIPDFMVQAGDPKTKDDALMAEWGTGGPGYTIEDEFVSGLSNLRGTIAMANTGIPGSGGSQWFINVKDNTFLDFDKEPASAKHPVFGRVISGMDVVDAIVSVETVPGVDRPVEAVVIEDVIVD